MQTLRPYQRQALQKIGSSWRSGHRAPLLQAPTGSGKTTIVAHLIREARRSNPTMSVLFLCPWRQLVVQGHERFRQNGIPAGILMGKRSPKRDEPVHVASIQTAARRNLGNYDLIIVDEAHRAVAKTCRSLLQRYPRAKMLGATATPIRLDGRPLGSVFDDLILGPSINELIARGHLVGIRAYGRPEDLDLSRVKYDRRTRDYGQRSLAAHMNSPKLVGDAVDHWRRLCDRRRTLVFACSKAHAQHLCEQFQRQNVPSAMVEANTSAKQRAKIIDAMRRGEIRVVTNVAVFTEGFDLPELGAILLCRPTLSSALHLQMLGRGMRPAPGKGDCIVLDHADNLRKHGFPQEERKWTLKGRPERVTRKLIESQTAKSKKCPACLTLVPMQTQMCPHCGHVWMPQPVNAKLIPLHPNSIRRATRW